MKGVKWSLFALCLGLVSGWMSGAQAESQTLSKEFIGQQPLFSQAVIVRGGGVKRSMSQVRPALVNYKPEDVTIWQEILGCREDLLATVYFALGIDPDMEIRNHLNQPRELVKGTPVMGLWS